MKKVSKKNFNEILETTFDEINLDQYGRNWFDSLLLSNYFSMEERVRAAKNAFARPCLTYNIGVIELILAFAKILEQTPGVAFRAIELFDRFCVKRFQKIYEEHTNNEQRRSQINSISSELLPIILVCIQLASKAVTSFKVVLAINVVEVMEYLGIPFSKKQTLDLEMEIFKNANFKLPPTALELAEHLIPLVKACSLLPPSDLHQTLIQIVTLAYLEHKRLYKLAIKPESPTTRILSSMSMAREADQAVLAGACLTATLACLGHLNSPDTLSEVAALIRIPTSVLSKLTARMIEMIFTD